jgi:hypothetical protein
MGLNEFFDSTHFFCQYFQIRILGLLTVITKGLFLVSQINGT